MKSEKDYFFLQSHENGRGRRKREKEEIKTLQKVAVDGKEE